MKLNHWGIIIFIILMLLVWLVARSKYIQNKVLKKYMLIFSILLGSIAFIIPFFIGFNTTINFFINEATWALFWTVVVVISVAIAFYIIAFKQYLKTNEIDIDTLKIIAKILSAIMVSFGIVYLAMQPNRQRVLKSDEYVKWANESNNSAYDRLFKKDDILLKTVDEVIYIDKIKTKENGKLKPKHGRYIRGFTKFDTTSTIAGIVSTEVSALLLSISSIEIERKKARDIEKDNQNKEILNQNKEILNKLDKVIHFTNN